jgi:hypothetical protein
VLDSSIPLGGNGKQTEKYYKELRPHINLLSLSLVYLRSGTESGKVTYPEISIAIITACACTGVITFYRGKLIERAFKYFFVDEVTKGLGLLSEIPEM